MLTGVLALPARGVFLPRADLAGTPAFFDDFLPVEGVDETIEHELGEDIIVSSSVEVPPEVSLLIPIRKLEASTLIQACVSFGIATIFDGTLAAGKPPMMLYS